MNASEKFAQICRISTIINDLNMMGITITVGSDFNEYKLIREKQENRSNIYPMFDSTCSFVDHTNGFWIIGSNQQGKVVHTQAIRLLEMSSTSLDEHLMLHRHKYITPGTTPNPDKTFFKVPGSLEHIKGKVCYHGEFWISSEERNQSLTQLLSRVVFDLALSSGTRILYSGSCRSLWHTKESPPAMDIVTRSMEFGLAQRMRLHRKKPSYG